MKAIDSHVHIKTGDNKRGPTAQQKAGAKAFKSKHRGLSPDEVADYYREREMHACVFDVDKTTASNRSSSNDEVAEIAGRNSDVFTGIASVDPWLGDAAVNEARRAIEELGLKGFKFQPISQAFYLTDRRFYPLWETISSLGVPMIVHMGATAIGQGTPGGSGLLLDHARPVPYLDTLAAHFPQLTVVAAHPGWPWHEELLAVIKHKGNVYMDLSGWAPKYFPKLTVQYAKSMISDKVLFGSDFPMLTPDRWMEEFAAYEFPEDVLDLIFRQNASKVFDIELD